MKYNVAVCDDEEKDLRIIHDYFDKLSSERKLDFDIRLFQNSEEMYLQYQRSDAYDIVFLDVEMPGMSGIETLDAIRAKSEYAELPIAFLSASESMEQAVANGEYAVQGFIKKPFLPQKLYESVDALLA